jgi:steroid delta-isomerase-like uncharacterized protein
MPTNAELIRRWFEEVWNQEREATIDELCAKHAVGHGQTIDASDIIGPESFKKFWHGMRQAFSSVHVEIHDTIEEGELVMARWSFSASHTGHFQGIAPTGKQITTKGMSVQRFVDGKMVEAWDNWDQLGVLIQMGAISPERFAA